MRRIGEVIVTSSLLSDVFHTMMRNEPLLESMLAAPLILKRYRWVLDPVDGTRAVAPSDAQLIAEAPRHLRVVR